MPPPARLKTTSESALGSSRPPTTFTYSMPTIFGWSASGSIASLSGTTMRCGHIIFLCRMEEIACRTASFTPGSAVTSPPATDSWKSTDGASSRDMRTAPRQGMRSCRGPNCILNRPKTCSCRRRALTLTIAEVLTPRVTVGSPAHLKSVIIEMKVALEPPAVLGGSSAMPPNATGILPSVNSSRRIVRTPGALMPWSSSFTRASTISLSAVL
mmetsp:Transcript_2062/g.8201  ORF Transcript_2062/g.8201 Transcript_2062/m.8201 type:complete len:213 (-) Transcript_2062:360-998(-)